MENTRVAMERAERGDTDYFERVGLDVIEAARDEQYGRSVFYDAVMYGHLSCCKVIFKRCPTLLYHTNNAGFTPLHQAAYDGRDDILKFLLTARPKLEQGENKNENEEEPKLVDSKLLMMVSNRKFTALHSAAGGGHFQSAKILIDADPSKKLVRMVDQYSETAMHYAVRHHNVDIVRLLVSVDPDFEHPANNSGITPLMMACEEAVFGDQKTVDIRRILIEKQPAQYRQPAGIGKWSLLHYATSRGQLATVKEIIGFWPGCCEWVDKDGLNFVHIAAMCRQVNVVKYVLESRDITVNVLNGKDVDGNSPLHLAMSSGDASVALALLNDPRVDKLVKNMNGQNPLDMASWTLLETLVKVVHQFASKGDVDFFRVIKVDVFAHSRDVNGETVLSTAVAKGHFNCCEVILRRCEVLFFETNKIGFSVFHTAVSNREDKILDFLLRYEPNHQKLRDWKSSFWRLLTKVSSDQKHTALHLAVRGGDLGSVKVLIAAIVEFSSVLSNTEVPSGNILMLEDLHKETAMHMAVKGHHVDIVKLLLRTSPDLIYSTNDMGSTPLLIALQEAFLGDPRTVEIRNFLIENQPNQCGIPTGINKWTLLHHATHKGDLLAIKQIICFYPKCCGLVDKEQNNILHLAAKFNHADVVKYIMTLGDIASDLVNGKNMYGNTPAHVAQSCGNQGIADSLLNDDRFDKTSQNNKGEKASDMGPSVPFQCAENGDVDFFRTIQVDVLLESKNDFEESLLAVAVRRGHLVCCEVIYKSCPELLYQTKSGGFSALHMAVICGKDEIVKFLINVDLTNKLLSMTDEKKETAMHYAVKMRHLNIVKLIVEADSNFEYFANSSGDTPLLIALKQALGSHDRTTVKIRSHLIEKQSSQICKMRIGEKKQTLLQYAISEHDLSVVEEITHFCRDCLLLLDEDGQNALHHAVRFEYVELVNYILGIPEINDSVLNGKDKNGDTPLHLATAGESVNISLSLLYDNRVRKTIVNNNGKSALDKIDFVYDLSRAKVEGFPGLVDIKELKDQSDFDLLVGALISTVSFTAGITVPGGFFSDGPNRGNAMLHKKRTFEAFVVFNTIALVLSLFVVFTHFCLRRLVSKKSILFQLQLATSSLMGAILAMLLAFIMGSFAVLSISLRLAITVCVICCCFFGASGYSYSMTIGQKNKRRKARNQQSVKPLLDRLVS